MHITRNGLFLCLALAAPMLLAQSSSVPSSQNGKSRVLQPKAEQLFALANQARADQGVARLKWDSALAAAALQHCLRMTAEGSISHRYSGEPDLAARAGQAGAHFSLIEENVAVGPYPAMIHQSWMDSPGHRTNLLSPDVNRVGIAVVAGNGVLYAVADYARAVEVLSQTQVEATVAGLLEAKGLTVQKDPTEARAYCANSAKHTSQPGFLMRWQNPDVTLLPQPLLDHLAMGQYHRAVVGSCPPHGADGTFTTYHIAVLLY
jgi:uncharacterized protein YkwD